MPATHIDPYVQTAEAMLCHVIIGDVGCPEIAGMRAEDACSRDALAALAADLGLTRLRPHRLADDLAAASASDDPRLRRAAIVTTAAFGRRIGALIATLRDPQTEGRHADTPVMRTWLAHWLTLDSIWLAGGLLSFNGRAIAAAAAQWAAASARPCRVALAPHPAITTLLGAARLADAQNPVGVTVVADLGHTTIKTAIVKHNTTAVTELDLIGSARAPAGEPPDVVEAAVATALTDIVRQAAAAHPISSVRLIISVAGHVVGTAPVDDGAGSYGCLALRVDSLRRHISTTTGVAVGMQFVHDATAAAAAGSANSATITLGTWPGSGFHSPRPSPLLTLEPKLAIRRR